MPTTTATTWVYDFAEGSRDMRELLGGKGSGIAEMTRVLGPDLVPAGFTITTDACVEYMRAGRAAPKGLASAIDEALERLEERAGKRLADPDDPLLVSVRSGARDSMPGMMDTVLNLGLNDESVEGLSERTGNPRFAWDSYRRLVQMFGDVVRGVPGARFEEEIARIKAERGVTLDTELDTNALRELTARFKALYDFPTDPREQLEQAIDAVFDSWTGERAVAYRRINNIPDDWGTAVNVQQMVFGNKGATSCSGVAFSRNEVTGAPDPSGDFLVDAQGEDVVSGVRTPRDLSELADWAPAIHAHLLEILRTLELHYGDMQDTEFTVEDGRLYMLQTRSAKRHAQAAVRFAVDAVEEGLLTRAQAIATVEARSLHALLHPTFDPTTRYEVVARGVAASPGAAKGAIVFTAPEAVAAANDGRAVILVRPFTEADDVAGFHAAKGILTSEGGKASHAALVARGMGRPAVTGAGELDIDLHAREVRIGGRVLHEGDLIAIDGTTGTITLDDVPLVTPEVDPRFDTLLRWCDELRTLGVRANADTPEDARRARAFGAEGVGLCRTEHMFMAADRQPKMQRMIMADDEVGRRAALDELLPLQQADFEGIFEAMEGLPITIRLLDPPLHEFMPDRLDLVERVTEARLRDAPETPELEHTLDRVRALAEGNPMLGTRGVRLGIIHPEIYEMQARAIFRATRAVRERTGRAPRVEIMIPLIAYAREFAMARELVLRVAAEEGFERDGAFGVGTMIELPRACLVAGEIATQAEFFSFGTNDLTQTGLGFSRDDIEAVIVPSYVENGIVDRSPFATIDELGVGELVEIAIERGRAARPNLEIGICGEHGGDPASIRFFDKAGLDYVSCSPFRVPIARVAAAQAATSGARS
jgi:pyruvate, orthophosphate dikinase